MFGEISTSLTSVGKWASFATGTVVICSEKSSFDPRYVPWQMAQARISIPVPQFIRGSPQAHLMPLNIGENGCRQRTVISAESSLADLSNLNRTEVSEEVIPESPTAKDSSVLERHVVTAENDYHAGKKAERAQSSVVYPGRAPGPRHDESAEGPLPSDARPPKLGTELFSDEDNDLTIADLNSRASALEHRSANATAANATAAPAAPPESNDPGAQIGAAVEISKGHCKTSSIAQTSWKRKLFLLADPQLERGVKIDSGGLFYGEVGVVYSFTCIPVAPDTQEGQSVELTVDVPFDLGVAASESRVMLCVLAGIASCILFYILERRRYVQNKRGKNPYSGADAVKIGLPAVFVLFVLFLGIRCSQAGDALTLLLLWFFALGLGLIVNFVVRPILAEMGEAAQMRREMQAVQEAIQNKEVQKAMGEMHQSLSRKYYRLASIDVKKVFLPQVEQDAKALMEDIRDTFVVFKKMAADESNRLKKLLEESYDVYAQQTGWQELQRLPDFVDPGNKTSCQPDGPMWWQEGAMDGQFVKLLNAVTGGSADNGDMYRLTWYAEQAKWGKIYFKKIMGDATKKFNREDTAFGLNMDPQFCKSAWNSRMDKKISELPFDKFISWDDKDVSLAIKPMSYVYGDYAALGIGPDKDTGRAKAKVEEILQEPKYEVGMSGWSRGDCVDDVWVVVSSRR